MKLRIGAARTVLLAAIVGCSMADLSAPGRAHAESALGHAAYQRGEEVLQAEAEGPDALPRLTQYLDDSSAMVRRTAAHVLARMGEPARQALVEALDHADGEVRRIAYSGLPPDWVRSDRLVQALSDPDPVSRNWLSLWLARFPPETEEGWEEARSQLAQALESSDADVRVHAVGLMARWETPPDRLLGLMEQASTDADRQVRQVAERALWPFEDPGVSAAERFPGHRLTLEKDLPLPKEGWRFKTEEPGRPGHLARWYEPGFDDREWDEIAIGQAWGEAGYEGFVGVGWYRRTFEAPDEAFDAAELHFNGVDESAWVWVNGQYAGSHDMGPAGWNVAFSLDVTDFLQWGGENHVAVRVMNTQAAGGIWQPVNLRLWEKGP